VPSEQRLLSRVGTFIVIRIETYLARSGTLFTGAGLEHLETAALIASEIIATLGDPEDNLGERLSWSMKLVSETLKATPGCRITKSKCVAYHDSLFRAFLYHLIFTL
jgi:hypothetical protein